MIKYPSLIETFLYECQCALFLVDINKNKSIKLFKDLIDLIKTKNFPYLKKILVHLVSNNFFSENIRQATSIELKEYLDNNISLDIQEIDLNKDKDFKELLKKNKFSC